jgi:hypothetical protein
MSTALRNAAKLRVWIDPTGFAGCDATGAAYSTAAFASALADGRPIKLPPGTFKLAGSLAKTGGATADLICHADASGI